MRLARRTFLASTLASVAAPAVVRLARGDTQPVTLKLHHALSAVSSAHDHFLAPWARKVEADSNGRIRIDLFPSMQLGGQPTQLFDQARDGLADIVWTMPSATPGRFPKTELFELPFVPARRALVNSKAIDDFARLNLADEYREVHPLCFSCADAGVVHTIRPVHTIEDMKGLKQHVQTRLGADALRLLGATPVPMPPSQLPAAIAQHVIDGCVDPWDLVPALKLNDLLKAHTDFAESTLATTTYVLAMNKPVYDRLPRDLKTVLDANSGLVAAGMAGAMWDSSAAAAADMVSVAGDTLTTLQLESVARWRKATDPLVEVWLKHMREHKVDSTKLLANARAALVKYANEPEQTPPQHREPNPPQQPAEANADSNAAPPKAETPAPSAPAAQPAQPAAAPKPAPPANANSTANANVNAAPAAPSAPQPMPQAPAAAAPPQPAPKPAPPAALSAAKPAPLAAPSPPVHAPAPPPAPAPVHAPAAVAPAPPAAPLPPAAAAPPPAAVPAPPVLKPAPVLKPPPKALDIPI